MIDKKMQRETDIYTKFIPHALPWAGSEITQIPEELGFTKVHIVREKLMIRSQTCALEICYGGNKRCF